MKLTWSGLMVPLSVIGLAGCGGVVSDANATPTPGLASQASPGSSPSAPACSGADKTVPPGSPDTFDEGKTKAPTTLPDGLQFVDLAPGGGPRVAAGQCVTMHYSLFLQDGTPVESSRDPQGSGAFKFQAGGGQVIKGFDEGVQGMSVGGRRRLTVPSALGYGAQGSPPKIPANATLVFVIQVVAAA
ncbi:MAG: FKBP-type peptidyl-prolyl cis-trans isomerase [Candidatus Dormiibacterota bacterium]